MAMNGRLFFIHPCFPRKVITSLKKRFEQFESRDKRIHLVNTFLRPKAEFGKGYNYHARVMVNGVGYNWRSDGKKWETR